MIQCPQFKAHFRIEPVPGEGLALLSERGQTALRGRLYELVAPLIDGRRSADAIAEQLDGQVAAAEVYHALRHLEKKGYLAEGNGSVPASDKAFWHVQNIDPIAATERLLQTAVSVTGLGGVDGAPLAAALRALAVRVGSDGQIGVLVTDDYLRIGLEQHNRAALRDCRAWMLVKPVGCQVWVGPVFRPGKTACWECLAERLRANREAETYVQRKTGRPDPLPVPLADMPATRAIACNLAATEIAKWVARGESPDLEGKILTLDVLSWKTQWHTVVRRPQCSACGRPKQQRDPAVVLESRKKAFTRDGGHRAVSPEETLKRYQHHVSRLTGAVTMLERFRWSGDGVVNVYGAGHNFARRQGSVEAIRRGLRSQSSGKGTSDLQAKASGLCEALERYCGVFRGDEPRTASCRLRDLGDAAIHPNVCMQYSERQYRERNAWNARQSSWNSVPEPFNEDQAIEWTPVWSLTRNEVRYLPTAFCYYDYPMDKPYCFACSNGNAADNTLEEAILQGFFELVERDAVALWWYNRVRRPAVDLDSFDEPYLRQLSTYLRDRQHRDLWVLDLTSDLQVPAFVALSRRSDRQPEEILSGFGAHFDARIAVLRAVTELNQMLSWVMTDDSGKPPAPDLDDPETLHWLKTATLENQPYLVPAAGPSRVLADFPECGTDDLREDVLACQAIVERQGLEMLVLDQTRPDISLPVVKVIVPGLRHFWARYAPGRLYDVPVKLGWLSQPLREEQLNPVALFL
ncbi:MAG: TOMM precursor leader peptide-binding protein [Planctomycetes bacterium]|nr:TOMM precursor leader peptide-binding protein [Planctomycetota bacterium]